MFKLFLRFLSSLYILDHFLMKFGLTVETYTCYVSDFPFYCGLLSSICHLKPVKDWREDGYMHYSNKVRDTMIWILLVFHNSSSPTERSSFLFFPLMFGGRDITFRKKEKDQEIKRHKDLSVPCDTIISTFLLFFVSLLVFFLYLTREEQHENKHSLR